ncbi:MAG: response regulator transcription factor [Clostridia bacterium]|nr:response regulator transcription factor [Clostridia bacterium]
MNIAVVEDDFSAADNLTTCFNKYGETSGIEFNVMHFTDAESFLSSYRPALYSMVFMDIELPGMTGLDAAKQLRAKDSVVVLIFLTKMAQYAQKGYEVEALDFMVKPLRYADFCLKIKKAINVAQMRETRSVMIPTGSGFTCLSTDKIIYVEVMGHQLKFQLVDGVVEVRGTLSDMEQRLGGSGFLRCSNCYLVNAGFVNSVNGYDLDVGGYMLKISHPKRKRFMKALTEIYTGGGVKQ